MSMLVKNEEELVLHTPDIPESELVIKYLRDKEEGASVSEILGHLRRRMGGGKGAAGLEKVVENLLETGTALGFLERSGSRTANSTAGESCGRKQRRRRRSCRRKRPIRRRSKRRRRPCRC